MNAFADHPFARGIREHWAEIQQHRQERRGQAAASTRGEQPAQTQDNHDDDSGTFVPPVDIFNTSNNWTLHVAVPGAKKEDVNVHWDADRSTLLISGLVYRPGDEEFLNTLVTAERRVGLFERRVQLPPAGISHSEDGEKEEVDADHITARMEDGILVVVVPKLEKEWTEVKKVDIE
ncbi:HSP20-like chaperone [Naviculisporaceae sp. PSN 640]